MGGYIIMHTHSWCCKEKVKVRKNRVIECSMSWFLCTHTYFTRIFLSYLCNCHIQFLPQPQALVFWGDKVNMLTHIHTLWGNLKWPYAITRLISHFMCGLMFDLVICKYGHTWHRMSLLKPVVIKQHKPSNHLGFFLTTLVGLSTT